jgi:hypothetical protein
VIDRNFMLGVVAGAPGAVASVAGNFTRHDPHMVSTYPDGLSAVTAPLLIYLLVRMLGRPKGSPIDVALGAGAIHGIALGAYTAWWLPMPSISLLAVAVAGSFLFAFLLAWAAAWAAWQPRRWFGMF